MTNEQIINQFTYWPKECKTNNLRIEKRDDNWILINYYTDLVLYEPEKERFTFNVTKYSVSTSRIQSMIHRELPKSKTINIEGCKMGFRF